MLYSMTMALSLVPHDAENTLLPLISLIDRWVLFDYIGHNGLISGELGILRRVTELGLYIALPNPLIPRKLRSHTFDDGLVQYFPLSSIIRVVRDKNNSYVNSIQDVWWYEVDRILQEGSEV